jgi:hypothetical protein
MGAFEFAVVAARFAGAFAPPVVFAVDFFVAPFFSVAGTSVGISFTHRLHLVCLPEQLFSLTQSDLHSATPMRMHIRALVFAQLFAYRASLLRNRGLIFEVAPQCVQRLRVRRVCKNCILEHAIT